MRSKAAYLKHVKGLVSNLRAVGSHATANDFEDLTHLTKSPRGNAPHDGRSADEFVAYLKGTLIPDLMGGGYIGAFHSDELARDLEEGIHFWEKAKRRAPKRAAKKAPRKARKGGRKASRRGKRGARRATSKRTSKRSTRKRAAKRGTRKGRKGGRRAARRNRR